MKYESLTQSLSPDRTFEAIPTVKVDGTDVPAATVVHAIQEWFGDHDDDPQLRLVVGGTSGLLSRDAVFDLTSFVEKGGPGAVADDVDAGAHGMLPGVPKYELLPATCPVPNCPQGLVFLLYWSASDPPHCSIHPTSELTLS